MRAKKSLGQNFLMHQATAERIADAAGLTKKSVVLEIGPGTGMLTRALLARAARVIAVEADGELFSTLQKDFAPKIAAGTLELHHADIRTLDPTTSPAISSAPSSPAPTSRALSRSWCKRRLPSA